MMTSLSRARRDFTPAALFRNPHVLTVLPGHWPRRALLAGVPTESRLFTIEPHTEFLVSATGCRIAPLHVIFNRSFAQRTRRLVAQFPVLVCCRMFSSLEHTAARYPGPS